MLYRQAIIKYSEKYGVTKAAISVYRWIKRYSLKISQNSSLSITAAPTIFPWGLSIGFLLLSSLSNMFDNPTFYKFFSFSAGCKKQHMHTDAVCPLQKYTVFGFQTVKNLTNCIWMPKMIHKGKKRRYLTKAASCLSKREYKNRCNRAGYPTLFFRLTRQPVEKMKISGILPLTFGRRLERNCHSWKFCW